MAEQQFPCGQCGSNLEFKPGASALVCPYCGYSNPIAVDQSGVEELDFITYLEKTADQETTDEVCTVKCGKCGAESTLDKNITSDECPFCGSPIVAEGKNRKIIKPGSLLPFKVTRNEGINSFRNWINKLWFAPGELKKRSNTQNRLHGVYIPYWTYDCSTSTDYTGARGTYYYVTESYTTVENGKTVHRTRQVRKTHWTPVSGNVHNSFDDILVLASESLPAKYAENLEPWDLENLVNFDTQYLSGFKTETYQVDLPNGFVRAKDKMEPFIRETICRDIGGDEQEITTMNTHYSNISFKHLLLPIWISAYSFKQKVYRFLINARTGEVQGEHPWSWIKITAAVLAGLLIIAVIAGLIYYYRQ